MEIDKDPSEASVFKDPNCFVEWSHLTYTFGEDSMSQAVGSRILVVSPTTEEQGSERGLSATVSSSLRSCGLSPEVVPETAELELEEFACVVYVGSDHERAVSLDVACRLKQRSFVWAHASYGGRLLSLFCDPAASAAGVADLDEGDQDAASEEADADRLRLRQRGSSRRGLKRRRRSGGQIGVNPLHHCRPHDARVVRVGHSDGADPPLLTCSLRHGLCSGDVVSVAGREFEVRIVSDVQFHALPIKDDGDDDGEDGDSPEAEAIPADLAGQTVFLLERASDFDADFVDLAQSLPVPRFVGGGVNGDQEKRHAAFLAAITNSDSLQELKERHTRFKCYNPVESAVGVDEYIKSLGNRGRDRDLASSSVLAGIVASQVLNLVTRRFTPPQQWVHVEVPSAAAAERAQAAVAQPLKVLLAGVHSPVGIRIACNIISASSEPRAAGCHVTLAGGMELFMLDESLLYNGGGGFSKAKDVSEGRTIVQVLKDYASSIGSKATFSVEPPLLAEAASASSNFGDTFFEKEVDVMVVAAGSEAERRQAGQLSLKHRAALVDVGADYFRGHVQSVIPNVTESYTCGQDCGDSDDFGDVPYCVLKSFPYAQEHAASWASAKVETILDSKPARYNEFWAEKTLIERIAASDLPASATVARKLLAGSWLCASWSECLAFARRKFEKYFNHKARQLLAHFPEDCTTSEGAKFWTFPKRAPRPLEFDPSDEAHLGFVVNLARAWGLVCKVKDIPDAIDPGEVRAILSGVRVPDFVAASNKKIVTDESVGKSEAEGGEAAAAAEEEVEGEGDGDRLLELMKGAKCKVLDDGAEAVPASLRLDLACSLASLRCRMYGIAPAAVGRRDLRLFERRVTQVQGCGLPGATAGCPCPAPVADVLAGLALHEMHNVHQKSSSARNWWISLLPELTVLKSEPVKTKVSEVGGGKLRFTIWDQFEIAGAESWTLQEFLSAAASRLGGGDAAAAAAASSASPPLPNMVVQGSKMVYVKAMPTHKNRLAKTMASLIKKDPSTDFVLLNITLETEDDDGTASLPPIKYFWGGRK